MDDYILEHRVTALEVSQGTQTTEIRYLTEKVDEVKQIVEGIAYRFNDNGKPGLITRLDRLEQSEARRVKLTWILVAAVAGLVLKAAVSVLPLGFVTKPSTQSTQQPTDQMQGQ